MNEYFNDDKTARNVILIISSLFIDILMFTGLYRFVRYGTTWRLIIAMSLFYSVRFIVQHLWYVEYPEGYNWGYPGFFSVFVPYGQTADFFYSGHVGICMMFFLEFYAVGWYIWSYYALFTLVFEAFVLIILRAHYTMDILAGVVFAHYFWILSEKYSYTVDWWLFRIPLGKRMAKERSELSE